MSLANEYYLSFSFLTHILYDIFVVNSISSEMLKMKILEFANSIDPDEAAHYEPPLLDLQCLPS